MENLQLTCHDRVPVEIAIDLIESAPIAQGVAMTKAELHATAKREVEPTAASGTPDIVLWWLDHTLSLLARSGFLKRRHLGHGEVAYEATDAWRDRDSLLKDLRPPQPKVRWARVQARKEAREKRARERDELKTTAKPKTKKGRS